MGKKLLALLAVVLALVTATGSVSEPASAVTTLCGAYDAAETGNGTYVVQNDVWNPLAGSQCVSVDTDGFTVTTATHSLPAAGNPASYPDVYGGCSYGWCAPWDTSLPLSTSTPLFAQLESVTAFTVPTNSADIWDESFDIWFDPTARTDGRNTGLELMVWLDRNGGVRPGGIELASGGVFIDGVEFEVWYDSSTSPSMLSYVATVPVTAATIRVDGFYTDAVARGLASRSWYVTSVQNGFELWTGGVGAAVTSFAVDTNGCR